MSASGGLRPRLNREREKRQTSQATPITGGVESTQKTRDRVELFHNV